MLLYRRLGSNHPPETCSSEVSFRDYTQKQIHAFTTDSKCRTADEVKVSSSWVQRPCHVLSTRVVPIDCEAACCSSDESSERGVNATVLVLQARGAALPSAASITSVGCPSGRDSTRAYLRTSQKNRAVRWKQSDSMPHNAVGKRMICWAPAAERANQVKQE